MDNVVRIANMEAMVDIETLGTGHGALILSWAAQLFNTQEGWEPFEPLYCRPDHKAQHALGRTVTLETVNFWLDQDPELRREQLGVEGRMDLLSAASDLRRYLSGVDEVWFNGTHFDATIIETLFDDLALDRPWRYNTPRDLRTLGREAWLPREWTPDKEVQGQPHHPVFDCRWQIETVLEARRRIRVGTGGVRAPSGIAGGL